MTDESYLSILKDELAHAKKRLKRVSPTGKPVVEAQIEEIKQDIDRYSVRIEETPDYYLQEPSILDR